MAAAYHVVGSTLLRQTIAPEKLHEMVFLGLIPNAGKHRRGWVRIGRDTCPAPQNLTRLTNAWEQRLVEEEPFSGESAWLLHNILECIHPFIDGNGRIGRLILNNIRLLAGDPWLTVFNNEKQDYYNRIQKFRYQQWPSLYQDWL